MDTMQVQPHYTSVALTPNFLLHAIQGAGIIFKALPGTGPSYSENNDFLRISASPIKLDRSSHPP